MASAANTIRSVSKLADRPDLEGRDESSLCEEHCRLNDDSALVRAARRGKSWAQREIWFRFAPMIYRLLRRTLGSRHDHDDLLQEVFLRLFTRLHTLEQPEALQAFVCSVGAHVVSEELRRVHVRGRLMSRFGPSTLDGIISQPADFEARDLLARIQRALHGMNERYRVAFVLRRVEGMALGEVAANLGVSLATVKRYLDKAADHIDRAIARDARLSRVLEGRS